MKQKGGRNLRSPELLEQNCMIGEYYRVICLLGKGGEGDVYLVRHLVTEQLRAAKLLGAGVNGNSFHELYMLKRLHHPSLPRIMDVLEEGERIWLIMEYIRGTPLLPLQQQDFCADRFLDTAEQLAEVLVYLHTRSSPILHLDIKPENILIRPDGSLVLIDFGTSIELQYGTGRQQHFGTRGFAAPEQQQENGSTDMRSDIYGFGAVMHYYLFGVPPGKKEGEKDSKGRKKDRKEKNNWNIYFWKQSAKKMIFRCLKTSKEERFQNSIQLLREIKRQKRWYHMRKNAAKIMFSFSFLIVVVLFSVRQMAAEYKNDRNEEQNRYEMLLETSEGLGFSEACVCYEEAASMYPADYRWVTQFVDRILEDYLFESEEEKEWNKLFFGTVTADGRTAKELLLEQEEEYGLLAYRMGIAYWYYYEETGGKYAAYKWFSEALHCASILNASPKWYDAVQIYVKIGGYYEKMGKTGIQDMQSEVSVQVYWEDLTLLWNLEYSEYESYVMRCQLAEELLACVILRGYELAGSGNQETESSEKDTQENGKEKYITPERMNQIIARIREFLEQEKIEENQKEELIRQCEEAEKTVIRIKKALE